MEKEYTVYKHTTPDGKVYIGATSTSAMRRWQQGRNYKTSYRFNAAIEQFGWENIKHEILFEGLTKEQASEKETETIAEYMSDNPLFGYNIEKGGNAGKILPKETREKMSASKKGKYFGNHRKHTEEEKRRISETLKGRPSPMKGRHQSVELKEKMGTPIICVQTGERFYAIREAERRTGCDRANIKRVLKGEKENTKGMVFKYDDEQRVPVLC